MERSEFNNVVKSLFLDGRERGVHLQFCSDDKLEINRVTINGRNLLSFGSCSYLGLEHHPLLKQGVHDAVDRFGTQFSSSRGYLSCTLYREIEENLSRMCGGYALCMPSTSLAHLAAFDALVEEKDALIIDHLAHASIHRAANNARAAGARVEVVKHGEIERTVELIKKLSATHRTVWFATEGVYSMYSTLVPLELLNAVLDAAPNTRIYIDDAHGMSWAGKHGRGSFLSRVPLSDRIVVAISLNKAFACSGGALLFTRKDEIDRVRTCGGTATFSGPIQPPMLGAILASTKVHLSEEIYSLQRALQANIKLINALMKQAELPLLLENETPIFFLCAGLPRISHEIVAKMQEDGFHVNVSTFPMVPMKRAGVRLAVNSNHTRAELESLVEALAKNMELVLAQEGMEREQLDALFTGAVREQEGQVILPCAVRGATTQKVLRRKSAFLDFLQKNKNTTELRPANFWRHTGTALDPSVLSVQHEETIRNVDRETWDRALAGVGCVSWDALRIAEETFQAQARPEHNWRFHYILVRDQSHRLIAAAPFVVALQKDDMLMREKVSQAVEERRKQDPYFLTSRILAMGSWLSEGNHLFLDRSGPWRSALLRLLETADHIYEREQADVLALRDLPGDDPEMDAFMMEQGLIKVPNFDSHIINTSLSEEEMIRSLDRVRRQEVRKIVEVSSDFSTSVYNQKNPLPPALEARLHAMYLSVASRKLRLNTFLLPENLLSALVRSSSWEVVTLHLPREKGGPGEAPIAFWAAHLSDGNYAPLCCGLDYDYVLTRGAYRQMLLATIRRSRSLGAKRLHLGMDAEVEKRRFGAVPMKTCLYMQARGDYNAAILQKIVAELESPKRPQEAAQ